MTKMPAKTPKKPSFEEAIAEVEKRVSDLESGEVPLEEAIDSYEQGIKSIQSCYEILEKAEAKLLLLQKDADGRLKAQRAQVEKGGGVKGMGKAEPLEGDGPL